MNRGDGKVGHTQNLRSPGKRYVVRAGISLETDSDGEIKTKLAVVK